MKLSNRASRIATRSAAVLATLALVSSLAAPVFAASPQPGATVAEGTARTGSVVCAAEWRAAHANPSVRAWKGVGLCEIDRRLVAIQRLRHVVSGARALTDEHAAALDRILDRSAGGLRELRAEIEADTTIRELRADIVSIFEDFRIYLLVTRQVWLVTAADTVDAAGDALTETAADLQVLIERAEKAGQDVTEAQEHLAAIERAIAHALASVADVADEVLPLTPADWNSGVAGPVLREARQDVADAHADLRTALAEARQVIAALA